MKTPKELSNAWETFNFVVGNSGDRNNTTGSASRAYKAYHHRR